MLNFIATGLTAYLLGNYFRDESSRASNLPDRDPESGPLPEPGCSTIDLGRRPTQLQTWLRRHRGVVIGVAFYVLVWRTRFGFDLRATGMNPWAAARPPASNPRDGREDDAVLGHRRASSACRSCSGVPPLRRRLPDRARLHRHRGRPARPQPAHRHRLRRLCCSASSSARRRSSTSRCPQGDRADHAGRHRAHGRHRLRGRPPVCGGGHRPRSRGTGRHCTPAKARRQGRPHEHDRHVTPHRRAPPAAPFKRPAGMGTVLLLGLGGDADAVDRAAEFADAPDLTSSGPFGAALRLAVPIGLAGLGGLWSSGPAWSTSASRA
jgi:hypothetical protein